MKKIPQRTAFITGSSRGIGAAIASELRARGFRLVAPSRGELDLEQPASIEAWLREHPAPAVDVLVNNAGVNSCSPSPSSKAGPGRRCSRPMCRRRYA